VATKEDVKKFLDNFFVKSKIFEIIFRDDRGKNTSALLKFEIFPYNRKEIIYALDVPDYVEGPIDDKLYGIASMWVFGKIVKGYNVYIKISMGMKDSNTICISFHEAEHELIYPFKP
jgi:hypothetical protein